MRLGRKFLLLLLCVLIVCNLTGCIFDDSVVSTARNTLTNDSQYAMSKSTKEAQEKLNSAMDAKADVDARNAKIASIPVFGSIWEASGCADKLTAMSDAAVQKNYEQYENAKATDEVYQSSVKAAEENKIKQYLPYIIVAILAIVVLLVLLLLMKKRGRTATPVVHTQRKEPTPAPVSTTGQFDKAKAYQEKQLQELCAQGGIDYNLVISKYGDDVKGLSRAYMALESPIRNGASKEEIMSKLK